MLKQLLRFCTCILLLTSSNMTIAENMASNPQAQSQVSHLFQNIKHDFIRFYSTNNLGITTISLTAASGFANTSLDQNIADYYQHHLRSATTDKWSHDLKWQGNYKIDIGITGGLTLTAMLFNQNMNSGMFGWANRSLRAYIIGAPLVLSLQEMLGPLRPSSPDASSYWHPFYSSHGVSGHAFCGAIPWMTAAQMVNNPWGKTLLYIGSSLTGLTRINDNQHYASQVLLGWTIAWLATRSISSSYSSSSHWHIEPISSSKGAGVALSWDIALPFKKINT